MEMDTIMLQCSEWLPGLCYGVAFSGCFGWLLVGGPRQKKPHQGVNS